MFQGAGCTPAFPPQSQPYIIMELCAWSSRNTCKRPHFFKVSNKYWLKFLILLIVVNKAFKLPLRGIFAITVLDFFTYYCLLLNPFKVSVAFTLKPASWLVLKINWLVSLWWKVLALTLSWRRSLSYRNQSIDLQSKSMNWFLCYRDRRYRRGKK